MRKTIFSVVPILIIAAMGVFFGYGGQAYASPNSVSPFDLSAGEKGKTPTVTLNSGYEIPAVGLGTWTQNDAATENSVYHVLKNAYRLIDTARYYGNAVGINAGVKSAIREVIVTREDIFITTKIVPSRFYDYEAAIKECAGTIRTGDLMCWSSNCLVLFYKTFSSGYSYVRLGRIEDASGLEAALGKGNTTVTFAVDNQ
jgi:hypothetical protein